MSWKTTAEAEIEILIGLLGTAPQPAVHVHV